MRRLALLILILVAGCAAPAPTFTAVDDAAVRAVEEAYRTGWLANDSAAVLATLTEDIVLMPAGLEPVEGKAAAARYWWPDDGSVTEITSYEITMEEVEGSADLAFLRGRGELAFTYAPPGGEAAEYTSVAVHLSVLERDEAGEWRIARRMWGSLSR